MHCRSHYPVLGDANGYQHCQYKGAEVFTFTKFEPTQATLWNLCNFHLLLQLSMYHSLPSVWAKYNENVIGLLLGWYSSWCTYNLCASCTSLYLPYEAHTHIQTKALGNTCPKSMVSTWCPRPAIKTLAAGGEGMRVWLGWVG